MYIMKEQVQKIAIMVIRGMQYLSQQERFRTWLIQPKLEKNEKEFDAD